MSTVSLPVEARRWHGEDDAATRTDQQSAAVPLAVFRIGLAVLLLWQALALAPRLGDLFSSRGLVSSDVVERLTPVTAPRLAWVSGTLSHVGVNEACAIRLVFGLHLIALAGMMFGWYTRTSVFIVWLTNLAFMTSGYMNVYGAIEFLNIALFYCLFFPVHGALSLDQLWAARPVSDDACRLARRVLQFHLVIVYVTSGIDKASGIQWWNGEAIWRALTRTDMGQFNVGWLASAPWLTMALGWSTLVLEAGYGIGVCFVKTRHVWVVGIVLMHVGIAVALVFFASVMILLNVCAWLVPAGSRFKSTASAAP
jgi:hypothetical protein